jgi:hypothetical protein
VAYHGVEKNRRNVPLWWFLRWLHNGRPYLSLPYFSSKYRGRELQEKKKKKREGAEDQNKKRIEK